VAAVERSAERWPALPLDGWRDTYATLHMWTQVVGKVCLASTPLTNHFWNVTFKVTPRGLSTPVLWNGDHRFTMTFDFIEHRLTVDRADRRVEHLPLEPRSVAEFYRAMMDLLHRSGIDVRIWTTPVEIPDPIPFEQDTVHHAYDPAAANTFLHVLLAITPVLERFRSGFIGKCSPVHFFWGSFDLAVTRFSGRRAPERPGADSITREAYSHEAISHGFWPGSGPVQEPAFYAYAAPEPAGFKTAAVAPAAASYNMELSEFILPYDAVRTASSPERDLTRFLETTYAAGADLGAWDRPALERTEAPHERRVV
jgi:hypothetical protein